MWYICVYIYGNISNKYFGTFEKTNVSLTDIWITGRLSKILYYTKVTRTTCIEFESWIDLRAGII